MKGMYYIVGIYGINNYGDYNAVDWGIKIICIKNFRGVKISQFHSILEVFLTVDSYNMDEHLESSEHLVYYQVSSESGITGCSRQSNIYVRRYGLARTLIY